MLLRRLTPPRSFAAATFASADFQRCHARYWPIIDCFSISFHFGFLRQLFSITASFIFATASLHISMLCCHAPYVFARCKEVASRHRDTALRSADAGAARQHSTDPITADAV